MDKVRQHFEQEARKFDRIIQKLTPDYEEMLQAMLSAIRFEKSGSSRFSGAMA